MGLGPLVEVERPQAVVVKISAICPAIFERRAQVRGGITTWARELELTDAIGQFIVAMRYNENVLSPSILPEKPGAGLARAGAGLLRAWRGPGAGLVRVRLPAMLRE